MSHTGKELRDATKLLPQAVRDIIASEELDSAFNEITSSQRLSPDQVTVFANELNYVLYGLEPISRFKDALVAGGIAPQTADVMVEALDEQVFGPIGKELVDLEKKLVGSPQNPAVAAPPSKPAPDLSVIDAKLESEKSAPASAPAPKTSPEQGTGAFDPYREPVE